MDDGRRVLRFFFVCEFYRRDGWLEKKRNKRHAHADGDNANSKDSHGTCAHLWKVGEKRFLSSFTLEPPFFTAFAALAALALASSATKKGRRAICLFHHVSRQARGKKLMRDAENKCESWRLRREYSRARLMLREPCGRRLSTGTHP